MHIAILTFPGFDELDDQPFFARGNVATAGGCLSSQYLQAQATPA